MTKYIIIFLVTFIISCDENNEKDSREQRIWKPEPIALINDEAVQLNWFNSSLLHEILRPFDYIEPDKFEIYISKNNDLEFSKLYEIENKGKYSQTINNLQNDNIYYFYVVSLKKGYDNLISDTIMVIPNKEKPNNILIVKEQNQSISSVSLATKINKIAYVNKNYKWKDDDNCCSSIALFISNLDGSNIELIDRNAYSPNWSPDNNRIAFRTEKGEINSGIGTPSQIAIYDYKTKNIQKITEGSDFNYAPVFSEKGEMILYQSTKGASEKYSTNLWLYNLATTESKQLTNIGNSNISTFGRVDWIDDVNFIFDAKNYENRINMYKSSINSNVIEKVIDSKWNDYNPSVSPNGKMIAFISDRSGNNQIWTYNLETNKYKQITGYTFEIQLIHEWNKIDWFDNKNITYTFNNSLFAQQSIE